MLIAATSAAMAAAGLPAPPCRGAAGPLPWCDLSLSFSDRASALVSNLTITEKAGQLQNKASPIPRLDIPAYQYWHEALHGVAILGDSVTSAAKTTSWPEPIGVGSSFNTTLFYALGELTSTEARGAQEGQGLTYWAPNIVS